METTVASVSSTGTSSSARIKQHYEHNYAQHLKHLKLKGLRPKTIDAYSRAIRRIGKRFDYQIDDLGEGLRLQVGDIDGVRRRVHIRDAKGNRDRLVPLPDATHQVLRRFWKLHRNPVLLFPSRQGGIQSAARATTHMDAGSVQKALHQVVTACGLKKTSPRTACATATPRT